MLRNVSRHLLRLSLCSVCQWSMCFRFKSTDMHASDVTTLGSNCWPSEWVSSFIFSKDFWSENFRRENAFNFYLEERSSAGNFMSQRRHFSDLFALIGCHNYQRCASPGDLWLASHLAESIVSTYRCNLPGLPAVALAVSILWGQSTNTATF